MCVRIKQRLLSVSIWTLTTCVFLYQGSLSERRRSFKTEVSFTWLFFCVGAGFGLLSFVIGSKCPCSQSALVLLGKTIRSGARLSKAPETFQARKASLSVSNNRELYTPETSCVKGASVYMWIKKLCNHNVWDFAMAFGIQKLLGTIEKRAPGGQNCVLFGFFLWLSTPSFTSNNFQNCFFQSKWFFWIARVTI